MSKNKKPNSQNLKVTDVTKTLLDTPDTPKKEVKFSKKTVTDFMGNLESMGFSTDEIKDVTKTMELIENKGCVTSGQGGGTSKDTEEITKFRKDFGTSVVDVSDGYDVTKTGIKLHYCYDNKGNKRYPTLYLRSEKQVNKDNKK